MHFICLLGWNAGVIFPLTPHQLPSSLLTTRFSSPSTPLDPVPFVPLQFCKLMISITRLMFSTKKIAEVTDGVSLQFKADAPSSHTWCPHPCSRIHQISPMEIHSGTYWTYLKFLLSRISPALTSRPQPWPCLIWDRILTRFLLFTHSSLQVQIYVVLDYFHWKFCMLLYCMIQLFKEVVLSSYCCLFGDFLRNRCMPSYMDTYSIEISTHWWRWPLIKFFFMQCAAHHGCGGRKD
jgi:hypothetical protein